MAEFLLLFFIALVANMFSALAGGGAGLLQFPVLLFMGLPYPVALATHKVASVALGLGATSRHLQNGSLNGRFAAFILACGLPGVVIGALLVQGLNEAAARAALGVLMLALSLYSFFSPQLGRVSQARNRSPAGYAVGGAGLFIIGVLNGSLTAGTGLFCTMLLVRWFGLDYKRATAYTLVLVGVFWNGIGALTLGFGGNIQWSWLPPLIAGALIGGYAGAHLAIANGNALIKRSYEVITLLVGLKLVLG